MPGLARLDYLNDSQAYEKQEELRAMHIAAAAMISYAERYAEKALELAGEEQDEQRKKELLKIAEVCQHVPRHALEISGRHCSITGLSIWA